MVTARLAIGSVSTLALGALLLGSAPYLLKQSRSGSHTSPWGAVSALNVGQSVAAQSEQDRVQLLKLAALKSGAASEPSSPASPPPAPVQAAPSAPEPQQAVQMEAAPQSTIPDQGTSILLDASSPAEAPQQVAIAEAPAPSEAAEDDSPAKPGRININTASSTALDHLPGAGRIGHAIVSHRPYKSVKDLVSRRILRTSDFQKIQSRISID